MNSCTGSTMMGPCSCGLYHYQPNTFSTIFPIPYEQDMCAYGSSPTNVDCTLSLGTPSTRLSNDFEKPHHEKRRGSNWWNILQSSNHSAAPSSAHKTNNRAGNGASSNGSTTSDSLFSRRCANCDTTSTPLWRNGPRGPKSLCNACGIRYKKEERRANAAAAAVATSGGSDMTDGYHHQYMMNGNHQWANEYSQSNYKMPSCYSPSVTSNEYRFMDDVDDRDSPFLSWRLNVTDRPGLVHDFNY
ncbi:GATA transcription factor 19-like [Rutidosis leptorrhynchoides]|uniref:GATA transcription factor 19-like n=1 Tax=Rutidosis leptorrhynchoides TaxID=125765 RepID=UPI003A9979AB